MTNLDSILKSRDITLPTKAHLVKAMIFPIVMYGCESWTIKRAEHRRIDAFELWLAHDVHIGFIPVCKIWGEIRDKVIALHTIKSHSVIYQNLRERNSDPLIERELKGSNTTDKYKEKFKKNHLIFLLP